MIGQLRGEVWSIAPPTLVLGAGGVGYELDLPLSAFTSLQVGQADVALHTHLVQRDDGSFLYGFLELGERELFRRLLKISGVGPKLALVLLSSLPPESLARCVQEGDVGPLTRVPGIGKKTAQRLLLELRGKLDGLVSYPAHNQGGGQQQLGPRAEAQAALLSLGYTAKDAERMLDASGGETPPEDTAQWLKLALRQAAR
nr:Holliday junction branch migration protein RuvA [Oceanococcus sp. HetDA_MAG_MS8]